jgi:hypothetical protein
MLNVLPFNSGISPAAMQPGEFVQTQLLRYMVTNKANGVTLGVVTACWNGKDWVDPLIDVPEHELYEHRGMQWRRV